MTRSEHAQLLGLYCRRLCDETTTHPDDAGKYGSGGLRRRTGARRRRSCRAHAISRLVPGEDGAEVISARDPAARPLVVNSDRSLSSCS
jgi:hypothetical protein